MDRNIKHLEDQMAGMQLQRMKKVEKRRQAGKTKKAAEEEDNRKERQEQNREVIKGSLERDMERVQWHRRQLKYLKRKCQERERFLKTEAQRRVNRERQRARDKQRLPATPKSNRCGLNKRIQ